MEKKYNLYQLKKEFWETTDVSDMPYDEYMGFIHLDINSKEYNEWYWRKFEQFLRDKGVLVSKECE